jgi:hypothetical protein
MATCFDFQEVVFRPFELIAFDQPIYEMLERYGIPYGFTTDILIKHFYKQSQMVKISNIKIGNIAE